mmetsp:Transcript_54089/g.166425  ORF Transcript_54089/g.166425 Transcript_54089/m.166425 type:complete len:388 (+) Transcript_54089:526-1689(+)
MRRALAAAQHGALLRRADRYVGRPLEAEPVLVRGGARLVRALRSRCRRPRWPVGRDASGLRLRRELHAAPRLARVQVERDGQAGEVQVAEVAQAEPRARDARHVHAQEGAHRRAVLQHLVVGAAVLEAAEGDARLVDAVELHEVREARLREGDVTHVAQVLQDLAHLDLALHELVAEGVEAVGDEALHVVVRLAVLPLHAVELVRHALDTRLDLAEVFEVSPHALPHLLRRLRHKYALVAAVGRDLEAVRAAQRLALGAVELEAILLVATHVALARHRPDVLAVADGLRSVVPLRRVLVHREVALGAKRVLAVTTEERRGRLLTPLARGLRVVTAANPHDALRELRVRELADRAHGQPRVMLVAERAREAVAHARLVQLGAHAPGAE